MRRGGCHAELLQHAVGAELGQTKETRPRGGGQRPICQELGEPVTDVLGVALFEADPLLPRIASVEPLVHADRSGEQQRNAQGRVEGQLARLGPKDVGLGHELVEPLEVTVERVGRDDLHGWSRCTRRARPFAAPVETVPPPRSAFRPPARVGFVRPEAAGEARARTHRRVPDCAPAPPDREGEQAEARPRDPDPSRRRSGRARDGRTPETASSGPGERVVDRGCGEAR